MSRTLEPSWMKPMQLQDELNRRRLQNVTGAELTVGQLVVVKSLNESDAYLSAEYAVADGTWKQEWLWIVGQAIQESGTERRDKFEALTVYVLEMDTSGASPQDPVYLSATTPGGVTLTPPANLRKVGQVLEVGTKGKVGLAPHMFQGAGNVPFVLDQKWRNDFDDDWETAPAAVTVYVSNVAGDDATGDGSVGNPYATMRKAILTIPHNRSELLLAETSITLIHTGVAYDWPGQALMEGLDRIAVVGGQAGVAPTEFTTTAPDITFVDGAVTIDAALPGTLNDEYRGYWLHKEVPLFQVANWRNPDMVAHIHGSLYLGGGIHRLTLSNKDPVGEWVGELLLADPNDILVKVNMRPGVFTPGEAWTALHSNTQLRLLGLWFQNATRMELIGNEDLSVQGCYIETLEWVVKGGSARFDITYFKNSTPVPIRGCLDVAAGAEVVVGKGNTMDGTNVVVPDAGLTSGTLASLWLHDGAHVRVPGGMWLRSHAHIEVDHGTFHREGNGAFVVVQGVHQGGPGYTVPGYVNARHKDTATQDGGAYQAGELAVVGPTLGNYEYVVAAVGHDITLSDDSTLRSTLAAEVAAWVSANGGLSQCSYDPGKGTRVRANDRTTVGPHVQALAITDSESTVDWARGESQILDVSAFVGIGDPTIRMRHPRLGEIHRLWVRPTVGGSAVTLTWDAAIVWPAGAPGTLTPNTTQLYTFSYSSDLDKYYGRHALVDVT